MPTENGGFAGCRCVLTGQAFRTRGASRVGGFVKSFTETVYGNFPGVNKPVKELVNNSVNTSKEDHVSSKVFRMPKLFIGSGLCRYGAHHQAGQRKR